jgi:hypothetical protein
LLTANPTSRLKQFLESAVVDLMESTFAALLHRVRLGEQAAAAELVQHYEPVVRREIRLWLRQCRALALTRVVDSTDICQSVLARFFVQASEDRLNIQNPEHLQNLLLIMARHRFLHHLRSNQAVRRDIRRAKPLLDSDLNELAEPSGRAAPGDMVVEQELLQMIRARLTPEERELADRRASGESWADVVAAMGGTPDARRIQLARAEARVAADFGLTSD